MITKTTIGKCSAWLAAILLLAACSDPAPHEDWPPPSPAMWEITLTDGEIEGWLFGTIHSLPTGLEWRTPLFDAKLAEADVLVVEAVDLEMTADFRAFFADLSTTQGQPPLFLKVDDENRDILRSALAESGLKTSTFSNVETWAAALMLVQALDKNEPGNGADRQILKAFQDRPKAELEGREPQLRIFDSLPEEEQIDLLNSVLTDLQAAEDDPWELTRNWHAGELEEFIAQDTSAMLNDPELRKVFLTDRNLAWVNALDARLKSEPRPFVAVGAAHMVGADGLPTLLEQRGYSVTRIQ